MVARILKARSAQDEAFAVLKRGGLVALPTETVYGLAADAGNGAAVARIFEAKGRPRFNPLIANVANLDMAKAIAKFDPLSERLAAAFWPGPLTLVLPLLPGAPVHDLVTAGLETIALRQPQGFASGVIARLGRPLAAPSANSSGRISPTTAQAVAGDLGNKVDLIVDGGQTPIGLESTIVKVEEGRVFLLRPGGAAAEDIERVAAVPLSREISGKVEAPGMLLSHYAPKANLRLGADAILPGEALLALVIARLLWGCFGSETARFGSFVASPEEVVRHLRGLLHRGPDVQVGHNPAGGWMVVLLLALLLVETLSGIYVYNDIADQGPLSDVVPAWLANAIAALHALGWDILLAAVALHVLAIAWYAVAKGHRLLGPMLTGYKLLPSSIAVPRQAPVLRAVLALGVGVGMTALLAACL